MALLVQEPIPLLHGVVLHAVHDAFLEGDEHLARAVPVPVPGDVPELPLEVAVLLAEHLAGQRAGDGDNAVETHFHSSGFDGDGDAARD